MEKTLARRAALVGGLLISSLGFGTIGFMVVEGYPAFDAFYMTLITVATVGYMEIHPLSHAGRVFNSFLILFGVSAVFFGVGALTQTIIELELQDTFGKRRRKRVIDGLKDHYIICGFGRVGRHAAFELQRTGVPFVIIDRSEPRAEMARQAGMHVIVADSTRDESLRQAGILRARGLVSALATDADNVFVILSAKTLNPKLTVVTRASEEEAEQKLRLAGADTVFAPFSMAGHRLAQALVRPHVSTFLDFATTAMGLDVAIEQVEVARSSEVIAKSLKELHLSRDYGVIVMAIKKAGGEMLFNPPAESTIAAGDYLIAMGAIENLQKLEKLVTARA
ncbi:MAG: potassium channel protein [Acidobacteriia bacterium]|jgi:voltage-gated potassium channel|nr:potassium channel protein [Terriglobia bacterium]